MKPELKALFFVIIFLAVTILVAVVLPMIHPQALIFAALGLLIYGLYTIAVSYFKFSEGVDSLNKKYEDK